MTSAKRNGSGRRKCGKPAAQSIPIRTELGTEIRRALLDAEGRPLSPTDYSQLELRILARIEKEKRR